MRNEISVLYYALLATVFACAPHEKNIRRSNGPKVVEAYGYAVSTDSMTQPSVVAVNDSTLTFIPVGKPNVVRANTNIRPIGSPSIVKAGTPRVVTPGSGTYPSLKTIPAIDTPFVAGSPEIVLAKDMTSKDHNPANFSSFGKLQGLKHGRVFCMVQDHSGNLWFGTDGGGVSKYDGKFFTHYTEREGLSNNRVWSIYEDSHGNLWFGTDGGGVCKYDGKFFTHYTEQEGLSNNGVLCITEDRRGNLWFGTDLGVSKFDGKTFTHLTEKEGLPNNSVWSIHEDRSGDLWFATYGGGVIRFDGTSLYLFSTAEGLSDNHVNNIFEDKHGNLWFATENGGVCKYDGSSFTTFTTSEGLSSNRILSIQEDSHGNFWFGTYGGGVNKYNGSYIASFTESEGLSDSRVWCILQDQSGNLWFGTDRGGVSRYNGVSFTHYTEKEGLSSNRIWNILEDFNGNIWFGTDGGGVSKYDGTYFTHYTETAGLSHNQILNILQDHNGDLWLGTDGSGISKYDGKSFMRFSAPEGLSSSRLMIALEDNVGNIWFGTDHFGAIIYNGKSFLNLTEEQGLSSNRVWSIIEDHSGNIWFGTYDAGITKYDGKVFTRFGEKEGLSNNRAWCVFEDRDKILWIGTDGGGVNMFDGKTFTWITEKEGLSNNSVLSIIQDKQGNLWFGTRFGLSKLTPERLISFKSKSKTNSFLESDIFFENYSYEDGFLGIGCLRNSMIESKDGTIWIGTNDRLTAYHPEGEFRDTAILNLQVTGIKLFNENIIWASLEHNKDTVFELGNGVSVGGIEFDGISKWYGLPAHLSLSHNNNYLTFDFIAITQLQPGKVRYQYMMEGLDENWSSLTSNNSAPYGNLPYGSYTFKVKAVNSLGHWSNEFRYPFEIRPPWWKTWWAYSVYTVLLLVVIWQVHRIQRTRTIRSEREKIRERELAQAKEIESAYTILKETQSQLVQAEKMASLGELTAGIAHEIQNPLNFVNNFSEVSNELIDEMEGELDKGDIHQAKGIASDIKQNLEKINYHGKRADAIVKGMLMHSRSSSGKKEPTDINALVDEYLRLSYHGLRAKDKSFNADFHTDLDPTLPKVNVIPQDIGRVLLNLINNAFYACNEKLASSQKAALTDSLHLLSGQAANSPYKPEVTVSTKYLGDQIEIRVKDNGNGIPDDIVDKIFQPFFTTKPTGHGTGLGLSMSYDIVKAHGGELKVKTEEREGTEFVLILPL